MSDLQVVFNALNLMEAEQVKSLLEGSGLNPVLTNEHYMTLIPINAMAVGGVLISVPEAEIGAVKDIFQEYLGYEGELPMSGNSEVFPGAKAEGSTAEEAPAEPAAPEISCPHCQAPIAADSNFCDQCSRPINTPRGQ